MNIAVIDDMPEEIDKVRNLLNEYASVNHIDMNISVFTSAESFLEVHRPLIYTVIFMDIYMSGMNGIEAAEKIRQTDNSVILIFITTSEEHRADAFHCHAYDYLVKPVQKKSLFRTMDDILRLNTAPETEQFMFLSRRQNYSIPYADLVFIRTESNETNYLEISECSGSIYRTRMTFSTVRDILSKDRRFLQIQRGVLINLEHLAFIKDTCCIMDNGELLPISVKKEKEVRHIWQNYMFDNIRNKSRRF